MRDIYKTAKKAQMAPVRGRVKAMMAQPELYLKRGKLPVRRQDLKKGEF